MKIKKYCLNLRKGVLNLAKISLKAARVNAELTQEEAAKKIGVSVSTIQNWESGNTSPTVEQAKVIEKVYKFSYENIIF